MKTKHVFRTGNVVGKFYQKSKINPRRVLRARVLGFEKQMWVSAHVRSLRNVQALKREERVSSSRLKLWVLPPSRKYNEASIDRCKL